MFDIIAISYAVSAAHHKSFNAAAKYLGVEQSLLSRRIKALEEDLDYPIFERSPCGVSLTNDGLQFIKNAEDTLRTITYAFDRLSHKSARIKGEICIGFAAPFSDELLHELLLQYRASYPNIVIHVIEGSKTEILKILSLGEIDLAIVHDSPIGREPELRRHEINRQCLWSSKLYVALPVGHELADDPVVALKSLLSENILVGAYGCDATINDYHTALNAVESRRPRIEQQMVSRETLINLVSIGFGITFTNEFRATKDTAGVVIKPISGGVDRLNYCGSWLEKNDNPALRSFLSLALAKTPLGHSSALA